MTCQDDAALVGPVSLFCGVQSAKWSDQQFIDVAQFAKSHGVTSLFIKVSEVGSGAGDIWYNGLSGIDHIKSLVEAQGVTFIPYTFPVGPYIDLNQNLQKAIDIATQLLQRYGVVCLDVEGAAWGGQAGASAGQAMGKALAPIPGKLWLSCPANPIDAGQQAAFQGLSQAVNVWMPMAYSDHLASVYKSQITHINSTACIQPTLDLSQEFGANDVLASAKQMKADGCLAVSLWYEAFARQNPGLLDQIVSVFGGVASAPPPVIGDSNVKLDSNGCVMTVPKTFQLETEALSNVPGSPKGTHESDDLCGPWAPVAASKSVPPGQTPPASQEDIDRFTDDMVDFIWKGTGFNHQNFLGVLPDDMIKILDYIRDNTNKSIHYQVIAGNDVPRAVQAGYLCLFSCSETNITAWDKTKKAWVHAYPWSLSAGHVLTCGGIEQGTGNWICPDQLNNSYQGYWPVIYKASDILKSISWACVLQIVGPDPNNPWQKPIPSGTPRTWPQGFNAQNFGQPTPTTQPPPTGGTNYMLQSAQNEWNATGLNLPTSGKMWDQWYNDYKVKKFHGPPTLQYKNIDWNNNPITVVNFPGWGKFETTASGAVNFYPFV